MTGFRALRFDLHPGGLQIADYQSLDLVIWDQGIPLMIRGGGQRGLDFGRTEWQTVEIPLDELYLRFPYLESIGLTGQLAVALRARGQLEQGTAAAVAARSRVHGKPRFIWRSTSHYGGKHGTGTGRNCICP